MSKKEKAFVKSRWGKKRCNCCMKFKQRKYFYRDRSVPDGYSRKCIKCVNGRYVRKEDADINRSFVYGEGDVLKNKQYLKDRDAMFKANGNGWWWFHPNHVERSKYGRN